MSEDFVKKAIQSPVVVFSKTHCPFCTRVKTMLREAGVEDLYVIELDKRDDCSDVQDILLQMTGTRTVPRVFIGGCSVGGSDDVEAMVRNGTLKATLKEAGAITDSAYPRGAIIVGISAIVILAAYFVLSRK